MVLREEHYKAVAAFNRAVTLKDGGEILPLSDEIHNRSGKGKHPLAMLCEFGRSMEVRRLMNIKPVHWRTADFKNAEYITAAIKRLTKAVADAEADVKTYTERSRNEELSDEERFEAKEAKRDSMNAAFAAKLGLCVLGNKPKGYTLAIAELEKDYEVEEQGEQGASELLDDALMARLDEEHPGWDNEPDETHATQAAKSSGLH